MLQNQKPGKCCAKGTAFLVDRAQLAVHTSPPPTPTVDPVVSPSTPNRHLDAVLQTLDVSVTSILGRLSAILVSMALNTDMALFHTRHEQPCTLQRASAAASVDSTVEAHDSWQHLQESHLSRRFMALGFCSFQRLF